MRIIFSKQFKLEWDLENDNVDVVRYQICW